MIPRKAWSTSLGPPPWVHLPGSTPLGPPPWVHLPGSTPLGPPSWVHLPGSTPEIQSTTLANFFGKVVDWISGVVHLPGSTPEIQSTTLANFFGKVVTFYHAFVSLPCPLFNVGFQQTFLLQNCLTDVQH